MSLPLQGISDLGTMQFGEKTRRIQLRSVSVIDYPSARSGLADGSASAASPTFKPTNPTVLPFPRGLTDVNLCLVKFFFSTRRTMIKRIDALSSSSPVPPSHGHSGPPPSWHVPQIQHEHLHASVDLHLGIRAATTALHADYRVGSPFPGRGDQWMAGGKKRRAKR